MEIRNYFKKERIAIDFGTANCVIYDSERGIVLQEPTVVSISPKERKVIAVGKEAKEMLGKVPVGLEARRPLKNGGISNYKLARALLDKFLKISSEKKFLLNPPEVIVSTPAKINSIEERALIKALKSCGIRHIYIIPEPIAASLGAGLPIHTSTGNMIVNIGGGTSESAVISMNGMVAYDSHRGAGDAINEAIINFLRKKYSILIGELQSEEIKIKYASLMKEKVNNSLEIRGMDLKTGEPKIITITSEELITPTREIINYILDSIKKVLSKTPPDLLSDVIDRGVALSGGTSQIRGLEEYLSKSLNLPFYVVDEPILCVAKGLNLALKDIEKYQKL